VDLYFSTFVKSMGSIGAFIAGPKDVLSYLRYNTRSQIFAKSLPMIIVEGMLKRMQMLKSMPELREKLWYVANKLQKGLKDRGFDLGNSNTMVTPVYMKGDVPEATAMVLDLRENGGGHLSEAIGLVNLFVPKGPVVQLRETGGRVEVLESEDKGVAYDGPLTILVDRFSASASEIFAAAMQDYGRGLVIGQETYGKGSVQNLYPLDRYALGQDPGYGQLTVTIGMYYRVTGDSTQNRGVQPDLSLPSAISADEVGESSRDGSLPWNRIRPATFSREGAYAALLPELQREHDTRIATDANFQYAISEIASLEKMRSEKSVSLNLDARKAERERRTQEQLARENARRAATGQPALKAATEIKEDDAPDAILAEATQITADLTSLEPRFVARARDGD